MIQITEVGRLVIDQGNEIILKDVRIIRLRKKARPKILLKIMLPDCIKAFDRIKLRSITHLVQVEDPLDRCDLPLGDEAALARQGSDSVPTRLVVQDFAILITREEERLCNVPELAKD